MTSFRYRWRVLVRRMERLATTPGDVISLPLACAGVSHGTTRIAALYWGSGMLNGEQRGQEVLSDRYIRRSASQHAMVEAI